MKCTKRSSSVSGVASSFWLMLCAAIAAVLLSASPSVAIILHDPEDAPSESERPSDNVLGRWRTNEGSSDSASAVAIGRPGWTTTGYILTTRHQGDFTGDYTRVTFNDVEYIVKEQIPIGTADLRLCRLENIPENGGGKANLTDFVYVNENRDERFKNIVLGGFGMTKGAEGSDSHGSFYYWTGGSADDDLNWGRNRIDNTEDDFDEVGSFVSDVLIDDFDGKATTDAAIAKWDSGGGWFYQDGDDWVVAGIIAYAVDEKSYFSALGEWDWNYAIRVSSYAEDILDEMGEHYEPSIPGDANLDNEVNVSDLGILATYYGMTSGAVWAQGDFNFDGAVDVSDLGILATNYGNTGSGIPLNPLPEPTSISLLMLGAVTLLRRRRFRVL